ncbi:MAG: hypothetical protein QOD99_1017 [Chthoniobacter sp.]|nr:hypothetical protein [Chthoniobacter sp.]
MANDPSIEAARTRIQRLVEEIAALSKAELPSEDFFAKFIERVVSATDAKGGAVWLVGSRAQDNKSEFQLCAQVDFASSLFQTDEGQRTVLLQALTGVVKNNQPLLLLPTHAEPENAAMTGGTENKTAYPFLHVPFCLKDQPVGVLQVWLQPYVGAQNYPEFLTFLSSLTGYVEQHMQSRRLGNLVLETQRLQNLLRFTTDLAGSLDVLEVSRLVANYGRDLVGCERASVLVRNGDRWRVLAISGQETIETKSAVVKAMTAFVEAHCSVETQILSKKELLDRAESQKTNGQPTDLALDVRRTDAIDLHYFQLSHVVSAIVCPMLDHEKEVTGAFFCESTFEGYFEGPAGTSEIPPARRIGDWITVYASRALRAARDYETLPFLSVTKRMRATKLLLTGKKRNRFLLKSSIVGGLLLLVALWPARVKVDGDCSLQALHRALVVPEINGRIDSISVREGDHVTRGQVLAQLDTRRFKLELESVQQDKLRYLADADRSRAAGDEAGAQVSLLQVKVLEQNEKKIEADIQSGTLRSPIEGVVMTKDLDLRGGEVMQAGAVFAEVDGLDAWELRAEINERDVGLVEKALQAKGVLGLSYVLYSQSAHVLRTELKSPQQISASAYPKEKENVFFLTVQNPEIPAEISKTLRPNLTGRAKLEMGRQPLLYTTFHKLYRWFQYRMIG